MDAFTIILSSSHKAPWWYYAIMATVGAVIGGYLTYRIGLEGGKETLEKRISKKRAERIYHVFERYGFWSVLVGAMSPPPVPIVPFLVVAGTMKYPRQKFLAALALGRAGRYTLLAYLGSLNGYRRFASWGAITSPWRTL
jgi:membrane protein YqaA with SNARE-associated domain